MLGREDSSFSGHAGAEVAEAGFSNAAANTKVGMGQPSRQDLILLNHFAHRI